MLSNHHHHPVLSRTMRFLHNNKNTSSGSGVPGGSNFFSPSEREFECKASFASSHNKVFGRHNELQQLLAIYEHISNKNSTPNARHLALIHGKSGVGKSALVRAFVKRLPRQAIFVDGKFDQLKTHAPYAALIKAANDLAQQALKRRDSKYIMNRIQEELGPDLNLLGSILEALSSLAKKKTAIATGGQAFTRFKLLMRGFFRSIATPESPVVLFLDDLQWADTATMEVLQSLLTDKQSACVFFIFSYRDDEMNQQMLDNYILTENHFDSSSRRGVSCHLRVETTNISVNNLDLTSLNKMVATVLQLSADITLNLSEMILKKTEGNPFYALNFMDKLYDDGMLNKTDDNDDGTWTWDATTILQQTDVSDNLAGILEAKVLRLPERVRSILQLASFIGHDFTADILSTIVHEEQDMIEGEYTFELVGREVVEEWILKALDLASREGLLEPSSGDKAFKFSHDKIQHCLYKDLMPDDVERRLLHQRIGKLIWNTIRSQEASTVEDWVLFLAVDNLNRGPKFVDDDGDRLEMIELNVKAGKLAASKAAFLVGVEYLRCGEKLLMDDSFVENNYDLCMDLWRTAVDMERIVGEFERSSELAKKIHKYARKTEDEFPAYFTEIESLATQGRLTETMELSFKFLKRMGVKFPKNITLLTVVKEFIRTKSMIGNRTPEELMNLPLLTDKKICFALELLSAISGYAFIAGESAKFTFVAVNLRMAILTLQYGLSDLHAPQAFIGYGTLCCFFGKFDLGLSFGDAAQRLSERFGAESIQPRAQFYYLSFIRPWRHGMNEALGDSFLQVYHKGMLAGDMTCALSSWMNWQLCRFDGAVPLEKLVTKGRRGCLDMEEYGQIPLLLIYVPWLQAAGILLGDKSNRNPAILTGTDMDLEEFTARVKESKSSSTLCSLTSAEIDIAAYFGDMERVQMKMPIFERLVAAAEGFFTYPATLNAFVWNSYKLYDMTGKKRHRQVGRRHHQILKRFAKQKSPLAMTWCKVQAAAKAAFVKKRPIEECEELFVSALQGLEEEGSYRNFSHVADAVAELFLRENNIEKGIQYLQKSLECNARWGAQEKVRYLESRLLDIRNEERK